VERRGEALRLIGVQLARLTTAALVLAATAACTGPGATSGSPPPSVSATVVGPATPTAPSSAASGSAPAQAPAGTTPPGIAERPTGLPAHGDDLCEPLLPGQRQQPRHDGPLPRSSTVVAARWCVFAQGPLGYEVQLVQSTGDVSILDDVLHDRSVSPTPGTMCELGLYSPVVLEVLDQHGRRHHPTPPTDQCGDPGHTRDALATTDHTVIARYPQRR